VGVYEERRGIRFIEGHDLLEFSIVPVPANPDARLLRSPQEEREEKVDKVMNEQRRLDEDTADETRQRLKRKTLAKRFKAEAESERACSKSASTPRANSGGQNATPTWLASLALTRLHASSRPHGIGGRHDPSA
jgi:5'-deoxynucleotidase YfbR-like HD superfamily hydrolase